MIIPVAGMLGAVEFFLLVNHFKKNTKNTNAIVNDM